MIRQHAFWDCSSPRSDSLTFCSRPPARWSSRGSREHVPTHSLSSVRLIESRLAHDLRSLYPVIVEPELSTRWQMLYWSIGYAVFGSLFRGRADQPAVAGAFPRRTSALRIAVLDMACPRVPVLQSFGLRLRTI